MSADQNLKNKQYIQVWWFTQHEASDSHVNSSLVSEEHTHRGNIMCSLCYQFNQVRGQRSVTEQHPLEEVERPYSQRTDKQCSVPSQTQGRYRKKEKKKEEKENKTGMERKRIKK